MIPHDSVTAAEALIPKPVSLVFGEGLFWVSPATRVLFDRAVPELKREAEHLAGILAVVLGVQPQVEPYSDAAAPAAIVLSAALRGAPCERYVLEVTPRHITIEAGTPAGVFMGIQTLAQLLPREPQAAFGLCVLRIEDQPRFGWRGFMLDVARHFFPPRTVMQLIDDAARYKLNRLHLHLSDDQGWRLMLACRPELARYGGGSDIEGGAGGYFTPEDYIAIIEYAAARHMLVIPEIDMPGHTHAALASCPELNRDGVSPPRYHGTAVGFSSLDPDSEATYAFIDQVIGELAALTPGPYLHIGGDEAHATPLDAYRRFIERVQQIVRRHGKTMIGWEEISHARLMHPVIVQHWQSDKALEGCRQGARILMSPSKHAYLDMKYTPECPLGFDWAGHVEVEQAYCWDPIECLQGAVPESVIEGVECLLWSETTRALQDVQYLVFPRLLGHAEIAWSPREGRSWAEYRQRLAVHGRSMEAHGVNFYRSPQVPWTPVPVAAEEEETEPVDA